MKRQCAKCPWKTSTDPREIPGGYEEELHRGLARTIAEPGALPAGPLRLVACHESEPGAESPCAGWLAHQLGPGNNLGLRVAVAFGRVDGAVELVGPQHETLEDTLPEPLQRRPRKDRPVGIIQAQETPPRT